MSESIRYRAAPPDPAEAGQQCCHYCGRLPGSIDRSTPWYAYDDGTFRRWPICGRCYVITCRPEFPPYMDAIDEMVKRMMEKQVVLLDRFRQQETTVRFLTWNGTVEEEFVFR